MFVEIAPNQDGKIEKLVEDAIKYLSGHQNTIIRLVSYSEVQSNQIKDIIVEMCGCSRDRITISKYMTQQKISGSRVVKNYVYGFDLMKEFDGDTTCLYIDEDAYYTSSISLCSDFTKRLTVYFKKTYNRKKRIEGILE